VLHFYWLVKADIRRPFQYGGVLALLLVYRLVLKWAPAMVGSSRSKRSTGRTIRDTI
jgi:DMSO/TMAO reductase YedYZ heme-binding membrane subunit